MKTDKIIDQAISILRSGGLIIYPTETCYGVGALATHKAGVQKLLAYKRRPEGKAVSIAVANIDMAEKYVKLNSEARKIYQQFLPGPVTVISQSLGVAVKELEAEDGTLGIRIPDYKLTLELLERLGAPITATSANSAGEKTPYTIADIYNNISAKQRELLDYVIDVGELAHNPPSTVINTTKTDMQVLRKGGVTLGSKQYQLKVNSVSEMILEGEKLVQKYKNLLVDNCLLVMFNADLGAGKTHFTKGIAKALGIEEIIKSPTYSILLEYSYKTKFAQGKLIHFDAWRLENVAELENLGIADYLHPGNIIAVEWAGATLEYFKKISKHKNLYMVNVQIDYLDHNSRLLTIYENK